MSPKIRQQAERRGEGRRKHVRRGKETQYEVALVPGSRDDSTERMQRRKKKEKKKKKNGGGGGMRARSIDTRGEELKKRIISTLRSKEMAAPSRQ